jgi:cytochrome c oxidase subunit 4
MSEHILPVRTYLLVCAALLALTAATVLVSEFDLGAWNLVASLTIAGIKAGLVILYFMHARYSPPLVRIVIVASILWLGLLLGGTLNDVVTRSWLQVPGR